MHTPPPCLLSQPPHPRPPLNCPPSCHHVRPHCPPSSYVIFWYSTMMAACLLQTDLCQWKKNQKIMERDIVTRAYHERRWLPVVGWALANTCTKQTRTGRWTSWFYWYIRIVKRTNGEATVFIFTPPSGLPGPGAGSYSVVFLCLDNSLWIFAKLHSSCFGVKRKGVWWSRQLCLRAITISGCNVK